MSKKENKLEYIESKDNYSQVLMEQAIRDMVKATFTNEKGKQMDAFTINGTDVTVTRILPWHRYIAHYDNKSYTFKL